MNEKTIERDGEYAILGGNASDEQRGFADSLRAVHDRATEQGFDKVASVWYDQTISYDAAREQLNKMAERREDILVTPSKMSPFHDEDTNVVGFEDEDGRKFVPTPHGWDQFAIRCHIPTTIPKFYLRKAVLKPNGKPVFNMDGGDARTFFQIVHNAYRHLAKFGAKDKFRFRVYNAEGADRYGSMRAFLTEKYAPIDNCWYLDQLERLIPDGRVSHFEFSDPDTVAFNVLIPDTLRVEDDSEYGGMISAGNCEIGTRRFEQYPSVFRHICVNGCIWNQEKGKGISQVHRGKIDLKELQRELDTNIDKQIPLLTTGIDMLLETRDLSFNHNGEVVKPTQILAQIADTNNFTATQASELFSAYAKHEVTYRSAFGIINAITRAGQTGGRDHWVKSDMLAGKIMESGEKGWNTLLSKAQGWTAEEIHKLISKSESLVEV